jgi:hypothetical protein
MNAAWFFPFIAVAGVLQAAGAVPMVAGVTLIARF